MIPVCVGPPNQPCGSESVTQIRPGLKTAQLSSFASIVILAFSTFDTGQPSLALLLNSSNCA